MPARRRAPPGCGPQARWLCCSLLTYRSGMLVARALPAGLGASSKMYTLFPDGPLVHSLVFLRALRVFAVNAGLDFHREATKDAKNAEKHFCL